MQAIGADKAFSYETRRRSRYKCVASIRSIDNHLAC